MLSVFEDSVGLMRAISTQGKECLVSGTKKMDLSEEHMLFENISMC